MMMTTVARCSLLVAATQPRYTNECRFQHAKEIVISEIHLSKIWAQKHWFQRLKSYESQVGFHAVICL